MTTLLHDPTPDGKSGPWMREPHAKRASGFGFVFDGRCARCQADEKAWDDAFDWYVENRETGGLSARQGHALDAEYDREEEEDLEREAARFRFEHRPEVD